MDVRVLAGVRTMMTRRGKMVFAVLDDGTAQIEISVFNELYEKHRGRLREDQLLVVQGKVSNDEYSGGMRIVAEQLYDLQLAREARAKSLRIRLNGQADAARLRQLLNPFRAEPENGVPGVPVDVVYRRNNFPVHGAAGRRLARAHGRHAAREPERLGQARRRRGHLLMRPLRIVHSEAATSFGGQEGRIFKEMTAMASAAITWRRSASRRPSWRACRGRLHRAHAGNGRAAQLPARLLSLRRLLRQGRYDVLNTHSRRDTVIAAAAGRLAGTPLIVRYPPLPPSNKVGSLCGPV